MKVRDVVGFDNQICGVLWKGEPIAMDLDVRRVTVEERLGASLAVGTVLWRVRLLDVEEHLNPSFRVV